MGTYLVQDPDHEYAARFIRLIRERYGHLPIAFFTRGAKERFYRRGDCPRPSDFAAVYEVSPGELGAFAARVRERHPDLVAVLPYSEETVPATVELLRRLPLRWNDPEVLARFCRKATLKDHLRGSAPSVRVNLCRRVCSAAEVFALGGELPAKFILKPDAGAGSRGVGVFTREDRAQIEAFFAHASEPYVLEEFLEGTLYTVDGLVDARGQVRVAAVFSSGRRQLNGSQVVYGDGALVHEDTELFRELAAYGRDVVSASGLRQSPFHMEVIRDARGPCLVEVGARLVGHSHAFTCERIHGGAFDFFGLAAAGYLGQPMDLRLDFAHYNRTEALKVYGASQIEGTAYAIEGVREVEGLPSFDRWIVKPRAGARLRPTVDLFTVPYSLVLRGDRADGPLGPVGAQVHRTLRLATRAKAMERLLVDGERLAARLHLKLGWLAERVRRALHPPPALG